MRATRLFGALAAGAIAAAAAACTDHGDSVAGIYVLRAMGDSTPPFVMWRTPVYSATLIADTIGLDVHGHAVDATVYRYVENGTTSQGTNRFSGQYTVRHDTVDIEIACGSTDRIGEHGLRAAVAPPSIATAPGSPPRRVLFYCPSLYLIRGGGLATVPGLANFSQVYGFYERVARLPDAP